MDLTKIKLHVIPGQVSGSTAIYLILREGKRTLVTPPVLRKRRPDLYKIVTAAEIPMDTGVALVGGATYPLVRGGYSKEVRGKHVTRKLPKTATRIFRVHPRRLSEKQRTKMAGLGEKGKFLAEFIEEGLTGDERRDKARAQSALLFAEWTRKESEVKRQKREERRSRSDYVAPENGKPARFQGLGAKDVAKLADLQPTEIRKFLRIKKIGKRGGRYAFTQAEAEKIARVARKYYSRRAA
jgi:hypothetical protein